MNYEEIQKQLRTLEDELAKLKDTEQTAQRETEDKTQNDYAQNGYSTKDKPSRKFITLAYSKKGHEGDYDEPEKFAEIIGFDMMNDMEKASATTACLCAAINMSAKIYNLSEKETEAYREKMLKQYIVESFSLAMLGAFKAMSQEEKDE